MQSVERQNGSFEAQVVSVLFPTGRPRAHVARFHISSSTPYAVDQTLLSDGERFRIDQALSYAGIHLSIDELNRPSVKGVSTVFPRMTRLLDNDVRAGLLMDEGRYSPRMVIAGKSGIYNALVIAGAISLGDALRLINQESRSIDEARNRYAGGMIVAKEVVDLQQVARGHLKEGENNLGSLKLYARLDKKTEEVYIGIYKGNPQYNLEALRQADKETDFLGSTDSDAPIHTPLIEPYLVNLQHLLTETKIRQPKVMVIGGEGKQLADPEEIKEEIIRQAIRPYDEQLLNDGLNRLGISRPLEIGVEPRGGKTKYMVGATAVGIGGVLAILALRKYQSRRRSR